MTMPTIWGIHMGVQHELRPIDEGYVVLGWHEMGDLTKLPRSREAFKEAVARAYPTAKPGAVPVWAGTLYRFVHEMKNGDVVVFPSKPNRMVNVGIVDGPYRYETSGNSDFPNRRSVRWSKSIPRGELSQSLLNEIGSAVSLFQVKTNSEEIIAALAGATYASEASEDLVVEAAADQVEVSADDFIVKRLKTEMSSEQFEHFSAHLLECMGYYARVTQYVRDGGIDVIAHKDELGFVPPIVKVQCKQTFSTIGDPEVSKLYGKVNPHEFGLFITLGTYSTDARSTERNKSNLRLIDGGQLADLVKKHYDRLLPRYQMLIPLKRTYVPDLITPEAS